MHIARLLAHLCAVAPLAALETPITGARQLGMGGAGVAVTTDHTVPWWNAAALGWESGQDAGPQAGWGSGSPGGIGIDAHAGFHAYGDLVQNADELLQFADRVRDLGVSGISRASDVGDFLSVIGKLNALADPADSLSASANAAAGMRFGRFAVGIRWAGEAFAWADDVDLRNIIPEVQGDELAQAINGSGQGHDGAFKVLDSGQISTIYGALGGSGAFDAASDAGQATLRIDSALRQLGDKAPTAAEATALIAATASGVGTLDKNTTSVVVTSFSYVEVPVSVGIPLNDNIAIGGSLKLIHGRVNGTRILVFQEDVDEAVTELEGEHRDSLNLGIDLGMQARLGSWSLAVQAANINAPTFAGPSRDDGSFDSVRLDPQVTFGLGWRPAPWFTLAADIEQFEVSSVNPDIRSRRAGLGLELAAIPLLDLRAGVYGNLADEQAPPVLTAGAGLGPEWLRLDAAVACASEMQDFGQWTLPTELRTSIGLSGRW
ncbi:MAG: conjugal transfer protein TraF [Planctomycetes bacterium]|nr:conjugal transfer protein TraF [Planctomycetota bacterium]